MALFKILQGTVNNLNATNDDGSAKVPYHEGYCYFTTDEGKLYIDAVDKRICLHAEKADFADRLGQYTIGGYNKPIYLSNGVPIVCDNFLPLSAGEENKITGALGLGDAMYGTDLPNDSFEG